MSAKPYYANIEFDAIKNTSYRFVQYTDDQIQIVLMTLKPKEEIGMEQHPETTQFFRIERGTGIAIVDDNGYVLQDGIAFVVPPGKLHNVINTSPDKELKMYTIYSPPQHPSQTRQLTKPLED